MIVFSLQCGHDHGFEAWFKDARAYDSQRRGRKVACPVCGDTRMRKVPAAPIWRPGPRARSSSRPPRRQGDPRGAGTVHNHIAETCEHVGPRFAEEARKIHYGESEARDIYGEAQQRGDELADEGVPFAPSPSCRKATPDMFMVGPYLFSGDVP